MHRWTPLGQHRGQACDSAALPIPGRLAAQRPLPWLLMHRSHGQGPAVHMQCVDCTPGTATLSSSWNKRTQRLALASQAITCSTSPPEAGACLNLCGQTRSSGAHTHQDQHRRSWVLGRPPWVGHNALQLSPRPRMAGLWAEAEAKAPCGAQCPGTPREQQWALPFLCLLGAMAQRAQTHTHTDTPPHVLTGGYHRAQRACLAPQASLPIHVLPQGAARAGTPVRAWGMRPADLVRPHHSITQGRCPLSL